MKKVLSRIAIGFALLAPLSASAAETKTDLGTPPSYLKKMKWVVLEGTVDSVDPAKRTITLKSADGQKVTSKVDENVKNLDQIKPGETVTTKYYESVAYRLKKVKTDTPTQTTTESMEAVEGPGMSKWTQTKLVATIEAIDAKAPSVTLKKPDGTTFTVKVHEPENLKWIKVGDQVAITYNESVTVAVEKKKQ
ncbi:MAG: hypothetical protein U1F57_09050 [bacterium]